MLRLSELHLVCSKDELASIPDGKVLINTINAHSYNVAQKDEAFAESLNGNDNGRSTSGRLLPEGRKNGNVNGNGNLNVNLNDNHNDNFNGNGRSTSGRLLPKGRKNNNGNVNGNGNLNHKKYLIPDGASIVKACRWLKAKSQPKERIAGWDLYAFEMRRLNDKGEMTNDKLRVMFMGSSEKVLEKIRERAAVDYPNLEVVTYSPPYKAEFSDEDNAAIIEAINQANPDLLWIGMTAPKQEKWTWKHWDELDIHCHVGTIGAVFDFYAGTAKRAPLWWQRHSLEWLYRLVKEPKRMWHRYVVGNPLFIYRIIKEKITKK